MARYLRVPDVAVIKGLTLEKYAEWVEFSAIEREEMEAARSAMGKGAPGKKLRKKPTLGAPTKPPPAAAAKR